MTTLPKEIRRNVNQLAHRIAIQYEYDARDSILEKLKAVSDAGGDLNQIKQTLKTIERDLR